MSKRVALIGLGMVAGTHVEAIETSDRVSLEAVCGRDAQKARVFAQGLSRPPRVFASPNEIEDVDFAILATPPDAREEIVATLVEWGIPILMEKPVERTLEAATRLIEICEQANVPLGIVLQHRFRPAAIELRRRLTELGTIAAVEIAVPWWRPQSYYDAPGRGTYARDGGGVLINQAIHTLDLALTFMPPVARVTATLRTTTQHDMEAEDFATLALDFADGAVGHVVATTAAYPGATETIVLHGTNGSARLVGNALTLAFHDGREEAFGESGGTGGGTGGGADPMAFTSDWHRAVIEDFADALEENRPPAITGRDALAVHRLIDAATRSSREGRALMMEAA